MSDEEQQAPSGINPSPPWSHVDREQLAELMGVHPDTVTDFTRKGLPVITAGGHGQRSVYDAVACLAWWRERQGKNAKDAAHTRALEASAKLNELKYQRERGELVSIADVRRDAQTFVRGWVSELLAIPRRAVQTGVIPREQESPLMRLVRDLIAEVNTWTPAAAKRAAKRAAKDGPQP